MRIKKRKKGVTTLKIDLEKAYNRINWSFIKETLTMIGVPSYLARCIMFYITNSSMSSYGMGM